MEDAKLLPGRRGMGLLLPEDERAIGDAWLAEVKRYEKDVLSKRV